MTPVATVVIPTRNRTELLLRAIASALRQTVPVEVFVMEDAGTDGAGAVVAREFPQVRFLRSETARGPTWQRNRAAELATTPYLVTLDDDCELVSPRTLEQALAELDHPRIAAVTLPFVNIHQDAEVRTRAPGPGRFATLGYFGGMVVIKKEPFFQVGGYRTELFMQNEESDLAIRLLAAGYVVRLGSADSLHHHESAVRDSPRRWVLGARNNVLFAWFNIPWPQLGLFLPATSAKLLLFGLRERQLAAVSRGVLQGWSGVVRYRSVRSPVPAWAHRLARELKHRQAIPWDEVLPQLEARTPSAG